MCKDVRGTVLPRSFSGGPGAQYAWRLMLPQTKHLSFENTIRKIDEFIHVMRLSCGSFLHCDGCNVSAHEEAMQEKIYWVSLIQQTELNRYSSLWQRYIWCEDMDILIIDSDIAPVNIENVQCLTLIVPTSWGFCWGTGTPLGQITC